MEIFDVKNVKSGKTEMFFIYNSVKLPVEYSKCHNKFILYQKVDFCISEL